LLSLLCVHARTRVGGERVAGFQRDVESFKQHRQDFIAADDRESGGNRGGIRGVG
jgi:hypothetical protein